MMCNVFGGSFWGGGGWFWGDAFKLMSDSWGQLLGGRGGVRGNIMSYVTRPLPQAFFKFPRPQKIIITKKKIYYFFKFTKAPKKTSFLFFKIFQGSKIFLKKQIN